MKSRVWLPPIAALGLLLITAGQGRASTLLSLDLKALTSNADQILVGRVLDAICFQREDRVYTLHRIEVSRIAAGRGAVGDIVEVVTEGGIIGNIRQSVSGAAVLEVGEAYLLFLEQRGDPAFAYVIGMSQGAYTVVREAADASFSVLPPKHLPRLVTRNKQNGRLETAAPWLTNKKQLDKVLKDISVILGGEK